MKILGLGITEIIALLSFGGGLIFAFAKFYSLMQSLQTSIDKLNKTIEKLEVNYDNHENRIVRLEEQNKTIFKSLGSDHI